MLELTKKLISFDTTERENEAMKFIEKYIKDIHGEKLFYEKQLIGDKDRYNLILKNTENPDVILAGHVDTVPELSKEQFTPRIEGNKLYGRGTVDMKAGVAINISLIDFMLKKNIKFWILCYADEESNFLGMKKFAEQFKGKIRPKLNIVTEPTNTKIFTGFRGIASVDLEIRGRSAHSARKYQGINAISEYVYFVDELEKYIQSMDDFGYQSLTNLAGISGGIDRDGEIDRKDNMVPNIAKGLFSIRLGNNFSSKDFEIFMKNYFNKRGIEIVSVKIRNRYNPLIQKGLSDKYKEYGEAEEGKTFGYSDVQFIGEHIGGDCLLVGPGPNEKSHQADEYVDIGSIEKAKNIIQNILADL